MRLDHIALWTNDLAACTAFWREHFGASIGEYYRSTRREGFESRFVTLSAGLRIELMSGPWLSTSDSVERCGWAHIALSLGSESAVDAASERFRGIGMLQSAPRRTGDGYYEAVIVAPGGIIIELTS